MANPKMTPAQAFMTGMMQGAAMKVQEFATKDKDDEKAKRENKLDYHKNMKKTYEKGSPEWHANNFEIQKIHNLSQVEEDPSLQILTPNIYRQANIKYLPEDYGTKWDESIKPSNRAFAPTEDEIEAGKAHKRAADTATKQEKTSELESIRAEELEKEGKALEQDVETQLRRFERQKQIVAKINEYEDMMKRATGGQAEEIRKELEKFKYMLDKEQIPKSWTTADQERYVALQRKYNEAKIKQGLSITWADVSAEIVPADPDQPYTEQKYEKDIRKTGAGTAISASLNPAHSLEVRMDKISKKWNR